MMTMIASGFVYTIIELRGVTVKEQKLRAMIREYELFIGELSTEIHNHIQQELVHITHQIRMKREHPEIATDDTDTADLIVKLNERIGMLNNSMNGDYLQSQSLTGLIEAELVLAGRDGTGVTLNCEGFDDDALDHGTKLVMYRIAREAIRNVTEHAMAKLIKVELKREGKDMVLSITDDGIGIGDEKIFGPPRHGFTNMRTRAALLNAKLKISSVAKGGTTVTLEMHNPS
ncbi:sensor histidine kinase [Pedobacter chitinilyticus]|nr:ATP-binding protein [Pedobacter chitinilyticus]